MIPRPPMSRSTPMSFAVARRCAQSAPSLFGLAIRRCRSPYVDRYSAQNRRFMPAWVPRSPNNDDVVEYTRVPPPVARLPRPPRAQAAEGWSTHPPEWRRLAATIFNVENRPLPTLLESDSETRSHETTSAPISRLANVADAVEVTSGQSTHSLDEDTLHSGLGRRRGHLSSVIRLHATDRHERVTAARQASATRYSSFGSCYHRREWGLTSSRLAQTVAPSSIRSVDRADDG